MAVKANDERIHQTDTIEIYHHFHHITVVAVILSLFREAGRFKTVL